MQYTGNNGQTIEYINNAKATINPNMYCYKLIDGHMRLKGICLGKGWEDWPFNTTQLSCYQKEGEKDMAIIDWSKKWPQAKGMLENGLSLTEIAKALDVDRKMLKSKYDREKRKIAQTIKLPVPEMCLGCARVQKDKCEIITEPGYLFENRGSCFARVNARRAKEIEAEIVFLRGKKYERKS